MRNEVITVRGTGFAMVLGVFMTGCATPALWKQTAAHDWQSSPPDQLLLVDSTNHEPAVIVLFRQSEAGASRVVRNVGWRLGQPNNELALGPQAIYQLTNACPAPKTIPLWINSGDVRPDPTIPPSGCAVWNSSDRNLTIHIPEVSPGPFELPASNEEPKTALRICVLPLAVAADAAIVGAVLFALCLGGGAGGPHL